MNRLIFCITGCLACIFVQGQTLTLRQCLDSARANNIRLKQSNLLTEQASVNWKQSRYNLLPTVNGIANHGINQGRSIDPFTNAYVNQKINYAGYGLSSGLVLFSGMSLQHTVKQQATAYEASRMERVQEADNLTLGVIVAYLNVLAAEDLLVLSKRQADLSRTQLERLQVLDKQGAISPSLVSDVKGQFLNDQLAINTGKAQWEQALMALAQLMNIPYRSTLTVERLPMEELLSAYDRTGEQVYQEAREQFALVKAVELRRKSAEYGVKAAKGQLYPSLVFNGNIQTNYSSLAQNTAGKISYNEQVKNNVFSTLNLGLRIPIFNAFQVRTRIRLAEIEVKSSELVEEQTQTELRQQIERSYLDMTTAYDRYRIASEQVQAYTESFRAAEARFQAGVGNSVDYLSAKNNLERAQTNLVGAQYDYVLRKKILDYYRNSKMSAP